MNMVRFARPATLGCAVLLAAAPPLNAETTIFPRMPVVRTQLPIAPAQRPPAARPPATPARPRPAPSPAPAAPAATPLDQVVRQGNEQILTQLGALTKVASDLGAKSDSLIALVNSLSVKVSDQQAQIEDLKMRLAAAETHLKDEVDQAAAKPFQGAEIGGVIDKAIGTHMDHLLQSSWPDVAVPIALFLILCALFGTMIIGVPINALVRRLPRARVEPQVA